LPSFFATEFPQNRENNREFANFFSDFRFSALNHILISMSCTQIPCKLKQGMLSPEQGIDPPEQGITRILLL
jgi:hypothetical protein